MSLGAPAFAYPQPVPSTQDILSTPQLPSHISFFFQVNELDVDYGHHMPRTDAHGNWLPPNIREPYRISYGPLFRWNNGVIASVLPAGHPPAYVRQRWPNVREYSTASAFIQQQTGKMLAVPFDVSEIDLNTTLHEWRTIGFNHQEVYWDGLTALTPPHGQRYMSILDFTGEERLAAPGSTSWVGELLPTVYDYSQSPTAGAATPVSAGLSGKLSLVLALLAFSCRREMVDGVLSQYFRRGIYRPHGFPTGRDIQNRGIMVKVYMNPWSPTSWENLQTIEWITYGPIFR